MLLMGSPSTSLVPLPNLQVLTHVLWSAESDTGDARDAGQVQLLNGLARLLLVTGVDDGAGASGQVVAGLDFGVRAVVIILVDGHLLGGFLLGELLDSRVGHFRDCVFWSGGGDNVGQLKLKLVAIECGQRSCFHKIQSEPHNQESCRTSVSKSESRDSLWADCRKIRDGGNLDPRDSP